MKSVLVGNGIDIQFGGKAYTNRFIMQRIIFNARTEKYAALFNGELSGLEVETLFRGFLGYANDILAGRFDGIADEDLSQAILDFKTRFSDRDHFQKYYDIPLEDWFMLLQICFIMNPDLAQHRIPSKQGLERMVLDAIYNDGHIQTIYMAMNKHVCHFFESFDKIFTLNYDNNIEKLCKRDVYHLHGDFSIPADSENPNTAQGFYRLSSGKGVVISGFEHCYCNALLNYSGDLKQKHAMNNAAYANIMDRIRQLRREKDPSVSSLVDAVRDSFPETVEWIDAFCNHPELTACTNYHFDDLVALQGELHIIGMSPQNDSHIFRCIDKSGVQKVVFYRHGSESTTLPISKPVEIVDVSALWEKLKAKQPQYNCNPHIPDTEKANDFIKALNALSFDEITRDDMIKELKSIPLFVSNPLCEEALQLMKAQKEIGPIKDASEQMKRFRTISQIALREGILPSAFYMLLVQHINSHNTTEVT